MSISTLSRMTRFKSRRSSTSGHRRKAADSIERNALLQIRSRREWRNLEEELDRNEPFRNVLTEYSHALLIASMRTSACNGLHRLQERCARWILMTLDRVDADRFAVTKEFLAQLLGTSRPMVSATVSLFEKADILTMKGRWVMLADRNRLEEAACECYQVIRKTYEQVGT
jgi:CRP-like cAMP-binding protein